MRFKGTLFLALVFAGLAAYLYFYELPHNRRVEETREKSKKLLSLSAVEVGEVTLTGSKGRLQLRKKEKTWWIVKPVLSRTRDYRLDSLLSRLGNIRIQRVVMETASDLRPFGLDHPVLTLRLKGKKRDVTLKLGKNSPVGSTLYAQKEGDPRVLLIPASLLSDWNLGLSDLRRRKAFFFDRYALSGLHLVLSDREFTLRKEKEKWRLTLPIQCDADQDRIRKILSSLESLQCEKFLKPESAVEGDDILKVELAADKELKNGVLILRKGKDGTLYTLQSGEPQVCAVSPDSLDPFEVDLFALRNKRVLHFDRYNVHGIDIQRGKKKLRLFMKDGVWTLPDRTAQVDSGRVNSFLDFLQELSAKAFVEPQSRDLSSCGLLSPALSVSLLSKDRKQMATLVVGATKDGRTIGQGDKEDPVVVLDPSVFDRIPLDPEGFVAKEKTKIPASGG